MRSIILTLLVVIFTRPLELSAQSQRIDFPMNTLRGVLDTQRPRAFILLGDSSICAVNLETGTIEQRLTLTHSPGALAISPDGQKLYVGSYPEFSWGPSEKVGHVTEFKLSDFSHRTTQLPIDVAGVVATDSGLLVVSGGTGFLTELAVFRTDTWQKVGSHSNIVMGMNLALHPSQRIIYGADTYWSPGDIHHFKISEDGIVQDKWDSPYHSEYWLGSDVFVSPDGLGVLSGSGVMLTSSPEQNLDLRYIKELEVEVIRSAIFDTNKNIVVFTGGQSVMYFDYSRNEVIGRVDAPGTLLGFHENQIVLLAESSLQFLRKPAETAEENLPPSVSILTGASTVLPVGAEAMFRIEGFDEDSGVRFVQLFRGTNEMASSTNIISNLSALILPGTNEFYAIAHDYFGASATSMVVRIYGNTVPTVSVVEPALDVSSAVLPAEIRVRVEAVDADGTITNVTLRVNDRVLSSDSVAPFEFVISAPDYGSYKLVAEAIDDLGGRGYSERRHLYFPGAADNFGAQLVVTSTTNLTYKGTTTHATNQKDESTHAGVSGGKSVWWAYRPRNSGMLIVDTFGSDFDTVLAVYAGGPQGTDDFTKLVPVAANDDDVTRGPASSVKFFTPGNDVYYIAVDGREGVAGNVTLHINLSTMGVPVTHDHLASALPIQAGSGDQRSNVGATKEAGEPAHAGNAGGASVWWKFRSSSRQTIRASLGESQFDTLLAVYTTNNIGMEAGPPKMADLQFVAANDDRSAVDRRSELTFVALPTVTYFIAVDGYNGATGSVVLRLSYAIQPFVADAFSAAVRLGGGSVLTNGVTFAATIEPGEPEHAGKTNIASVWYRWTAPTNGYVSISTRTSDFDTLLAIYTGDVLTHLTVIASNDDDPANRPSSAVIFYATAGTEYKIAIAGYENARGEFVLAINQAPTFQPRLYSQWLDGRLWIEVGDARDPAVLESSSDLINWEVARVIDAGELAFEIALEGGMPMRFYRVRQGPR